MDPAAVLVHRFQISTELSHSQLLTFPRFIRERLAFGQLPGIRMGVMESYASTRGHYLEFVAGPDRGTYLATVRMYLERPIVVELWSTQGPNDDFAKQLNEVLLIAIQFFEEEARRTTLYMAFMPGRPKTAELRRKASPMKIVFGGNMLNLFLLLIIVGIPLVIILKEYAPFALLAIMTTLVLSAGKLMSLRTPWRVTKDTREVVIVQHVVPEGELEKYRSEYLDRIKMAKRRVYDLFADCPEGLCEEKVAEIFASAGLPADKKDFLIRRVDVYAIVERVAAKFGIPVPTVVITQDVNPNAAATGFTKRLATMLITMGLLVQLDEEEVEVVVGHELSHLKSGDPIVLYSLITTEYLGRIYLWQPYISQFWFLYLLGVFWCIFFFGKFLESRADLEAGLILGKPKVMAESLKKIGFRRLVLEERYLEPGVSRLGEWMKFDPHPPLYFRIQRLESLDLSNPPRHPFLSSVRAVARGFIHSGRAP
ncbi:MAG: M56 family metallopeptidase [Thermoplasmata archaeon]